MSVSYDIILAGLKRGGRDLELIISHNNTDFDGLAAMVAASKLYPDAVLVVEGKPTRQVREFLALHKDALPLTDIKNITLEKVTLVILVDTRRMSRVGSVAKLLERGQVPVHIYDHHPPTAGDIKGDLEVVEYLGAATSILVELIRDRKVALSPFEATLLALGIYEDTGSLLFEGSTARDAMALAYLLESGANLKIVGEFMDRPLSREQKSLLDSLLVSARHHLIKGIKVLITTTSVDEYVGGLALLTHKVSEIENLDVIFSVVKMDDRVHIVARGKGKHVAVNEILREFGGAGHPKAASATVKKGEVEAIVIKILELLEAKVIPETRAKEIMSPVVRSIPTQATIEQAQTVLLRYGHTGIPVVEGEKLVGIISRRDVDKALHHGLGHAMVTGYMSRKVITIGPDTPLNEIQELMITHDIGRLPVVQDGVLTGIISRSDVLRTLHGQAIPVSYQILRQRSLVQGQEILRLIEALPQEVRDLFRLIQVLGREHGLRVYVVGGFVRDLLLGVPNLDIDFVVEGDGLALAGLLAEELEAQVQFHPQFGTANLVTKEGLNLDVVTARTEYYDYPASLPRVESSTLKQDLYRRDFTINAMAIELDDENFGCFRDYYGGFRDLQQGEIRILHNLSFVDDPTRILRALRFEQRLGFRIENQTQQLIKAAIEEQLFNRLSRDRLKEELILLLQETRAAEALERLGELGGWQQLFAELPRGDLRGRFAQVDAARDFLQGIGLWNGNSLWQVKLIVLFSGADSDVTAHVVKSLNFERRIVSQIREFLGAEAALKGFLAWESELTMGMVHRVLKRVPKQVLAALSTLPEISAVLREYLTVWAGTKVLTSGKDLQSMGLSPGPVYGKILSVLWDARLEGRVKNKQEEIKLIESILKGEKNVQ
ncbi:MAG TPA: CBS domain-containing protein [Verrucomicrobiae bacterium]|nr:CBS domain-containing protein [Verrucomicrobiae bacterium]